MKKLIFAAFAALLAVGCGNHPHEQKEAKTDTLPIETKHVLSREDTINAMALAFVKQESNFKHDAVSPCGRWVGCLQISKIMVREANRIVGVDCFNYNDRYDRQGSYAIFRIVQQHHNPSYNIDKAVDIWNPGASKTYRNNIKKYFETTLKSKEPLLYFD